MPRDRRGSPAPLRNRSSGATQPSLRCLLATEQKASFWSWRSSSVGLSDQRRRISEMVGSELSPSAGALEEVRRLAGSSAAIQSVIRLEGGQHADTWRVDTANPELTVVLRQFPAADSAGGREQRVLRTLGGLGGLAPVLLGGDLDGRWSEYPTSLID